MARWYVQRSLRVIDESVLGPERPIYEADRPRMRAALLQLDLSDWR
jgi:hypothetical protein